MITKSKVLLLDSKLKKPFVAELSPVFKPFGLCTGLAEELQLHLLELTGTEGEVTRRDLIPEGLSDLTDAEGYLLPGGTLYVLEVYEDSLCGLGTKIYHVLCILGYALEGLEHQVEFTDLREVMLSAGRTRDIMLLDKILHLLMGPGDDFRFIPNLLSTELPQLVRPSGWKGHRARPNP